MAGSVAARWAAWQQRQRASLPAPLGGAPNSGVPFAHPSLAGYSIVVEVYLLGDWRDITADVFQADGRVITMTQGRADQATTSQPASCSFTVNNRTGAYSKSPISQWWPNLGQGTPLRVRVVGAGIDSPRFQGTIRGATPAWDDSGNLASVAIQADGISQKLQRDKNSADSPMYRAYSRRAEMVGYWPMEDGSFATQFASAVPDGQPITVIQNVTFAGTSVTHPGSKPLALLKGLAIIGPVPVPAHTFSGNWQVDFQLYLPSTIPTGGKVFSVQSNGTAIYWDIGINNDFGGTISLAAYSASGQVVNSGEFALPSYMYGAWSHIRLMVQNSGTSITWQVVTFPLSGSGSFFNGTLASAVVGDVTGIAPGGLYNNVGSDFTGVGIGQAVVFDAFNLGAVDAAKNGWFGETAVNRMVRVCGEESVPFDYSTGTGTPSLMGYQPIDTFTNIMLDCEQTDGGILYDGRNTGYTYRPRGAGYTHTANLTLDAAAGELALPFSPVDDDLLRVNRFEMSRDTGSKAVFTAESGPYDVTHIGEYKRSDTINVSTDNVLLGQAAWRVHKGTYRTPYRYPKLSINIVRTPALAMRWIDPSVVTGCRVDVLNVDHLRRQHPPAPLLNYLTGYTERLSPYVWNADLVCQPGDPWVIASFGNEFRLDTGGSQLSQDAAVGATTLQVATTGDKLWTTTATYPADFPFALSVGGWYVLVTGITGTTSPQTFTLDSSTPLTAAVNTGGQVKLWQPTALGL